MLVSKRIQEEKKRKNKIPLSHLFLTVRIFRGGLFGFCFVLFPLRRIEDAYVQARQAWVANSLALMHDDDVVANLVPPLHFWMCSLLLGWLLSSPRSVFVSARTERADVREVVGRFASVDQSSLIPDWIFLKAAHSETRGRESSCLRTEQRHWISLTVRASYWSLLKSARSFWCQGKE